MKKEIKWMVIGLVLSAQAIRAGNYDDVADYRNLTSKNLPHMQVMVHKAIDHTTSGRMDMLRVKKRIRWSNLLPIVEVRYGQTDTQQNNYGQVSLQDERNWPYQTNTGGVYDMEGERTYTTALDQTSAWQPFWNVTVQWEISKFFYSRDQTYSRYIKEQQMYYQQRVVKEVIKLYESLEMLMGQRGDGEDVMLEIDISAVAVKLDFVTGDFLSDVILATSPIEVVNTAITEFATADLVPANEKELAKLNQESGEMVQFVNALNDAGNAFDVRVAE